MAVIVVTFGVDADGDGFVRDLASLGIMPRAMSEARAGGHGEPYDGHRLLVVEVEASEVAAAATLAVSWHGLLHEPPYSEPLI